MFSILEHRKSGKHRCSESLSIKVNVNSSGNSTTLKLIPWWGEALQDTGMIRLVYLDCIHGNWHLCLEFKRAYLYWSLFLCNARISATLRAQVISKFWTPEQLGSGSDGLNCAQEWLYCKLKPVCHRVSILPSAYTANTSWAKCYQISMFQPSKQTIAHPSAFPKPCVAISMCNPTCSYV